MAGRRAQAPRAVAGTQAVGVDDPQVDRAIAVVRDSAERLQAARQEAVIEADLAIGTNRVRHGLGRALAGYTLTPTVASAAFAHCLNRDNPRPDLEAWIDVIGADQPGAIVKVF
jgi:hypothetical protein